MFVGILITHTAHRILSFFSILFFNGENEIKIFYIGTKYKMNKNGGWSYQFISGLVFSMSN